MKRTELYETFAELVTYPSPAMLELLRGDALMSMLDDGNTGGNEALRECFATFIRETEALSYEEFEELYTRTFDINPVASLEIGWHLYGEQYERGVFMVRMRGLLRELGIEESTELPDHLTHVLRLLSRMKGEEASSFATRYVLHAVVKVLEGFKEKENPYEHLLLGIKMKIEQTFAPGVLAHE